MTDEQPKALWLADMLEKGFRVDGPDSEAAAELRRLHALCARAMVEPDMAEVRPGMSGWKGAAIAWEVCASIHREYAKKKDPFFTTRQADFVKHAACARAMVQPAAPDMAEVERLVSEHEYKLECYHSGIVWAGKTKATRTALLDYVRGVMAERDALIHDNERSIHGDAHESVGYARGKLEAVPSGYWLAPVEPTPEMKSAGLNVEVGENNHVLTWTEVAAIYREMRDASLHGEVKP